VRKPVDKIKMLSLHVGRRTRLLEKPRRSLRLVSVRLMLLVCFYVIRVVSS
jgi:hypothetical protein